MRRPRRKTYMYMIVLNLSSSLAAVDCGALTAPTNGFSFGNLTTFPNTITFSCDVGFDLVGSFSRTCMPNKSWSGEVPVCKGNHR